MHERIVHRVGAGRPFEHALDVACGTGQSTQILVDLAHLVVGSDLSASMLAAAPTLPRICYVQSSAENLPFTDVSFGLITVALAFHWFERDRFLAEARRLLRPGGWLIIYDNSFRAELRGNPAFQGWFLGRYLARYPSPPRDRTPLTDEEVGSFGLELVARETYENEIEFSRDQLVAYLMTQSNVIAAIEEGTESEESVRNWLSGEIRQFAGDVRSVFLFGGPIDFLRKLR